MMRHSRCQLAACVLLSKVDAQHLLVMGSSLLQHPVAEQQKQRREQSWARLLLSTGAAGDLRAAGQANNS